MGKAVLGPKKGQYGPTRNKEDTNHVIQPTDEFRKPSETSEIDNDIIVLSPPDNDEESNSNNDNEESSGQRETQPIIADGDDDIRGPVDSLLDQGNDIFNIEAQ